MNVRQYVLPAASALLFVATLCGQSPERPPTTPLVAHDPYFSVWSTTDKLTDSPTKHWTGHNQPLNSMVRIDGKAYRVMGSDPRNTPAMEQTGSELTPTHTRYHFAAAGVAIDLVFFTPAFLDNMDLLSRPVTYLSWTAHATDGGQHQVSVFLNANGEMATSYSGQPVAFSRQQTGGATVLSVGTKSQDVLNRSGDDLKIDWGYFHIAVPQNEAASSVFSNRTAQTFAADGALPFTDDIDGPAAGQKGVQEMAVALPFGAVGAQPVSKFVMLSYTEGFAMEYLDRRVRPYWQRDGKTVSAMLTEAQNEYAQLDARGDAFDKQLTADLTKTAGEHYAWLCTLAYRESIAAHKLVADVDGQPMLFAKENFSNGDTATVDVLYPSAPIFLFFNPQLLHAQVLPVLAYASLPNRWRFPFAPHDLGRYPLANGQDYGGGEKTEEDQMPVEESGNMLILVDALARLEKNNAGIELAQKYWPELTKWANFLHEHGLDPENQLTTDDFAGHVTHNANLALKAIDAMEAYADLARLLHHDAEAKKFSADAHSYAKKWMEMDREGDHYKLAYDSPNTWSQKYNLVWDKVLDYNLFPKSVRDSEIAFYKTKLNVYGLPLDSRKGYTKLDWELWTATLADNKADFDTLVDPLYKWANETTSRVPMTDWYDTKTGKQESFQARSVVGGLFIKALADKPLAERYRKQAK
ncbi:MAG: glutaminase domain-containing protein [Janthinobacterium lividum]